MFGVTSARTFRATFAIPVCVFLSFVTPPQLRAGSQAPTITSYLDWTILWRDVALRRVLQRERESSFRPGFASEYLEAMQLYHFTMESLSFDPQ